MFGLFEKRITIAESGLMRGLNDQHTHILPAVDDGISSLEDALAVLTYYESMGVRRVVCTPHIMEEFKMNTSESLRRAFGELESAYSGPIELALAAEYMLDSNFPKILESNDLLPLMDGYLLVETSCYGPANNFFEIIDSIKSKGYNVVLAHPERYLYMEPREYELLKSRGVLFQLNLLSLVGIYGHDVVESTKQLLDNGYYDLVGCDIHSLPHHKRHIQNCKIPKKYLIQIAEIRGSV